MDYTGTRTVALNPPSGLLPSVISPPWKAGGDVAGDGEAEACAAMVLVAGFVEKRRNGFEHVLCCRSSGTPGHVIVDMDDEIADVRAGQRS